MVVARGVGMSTKAGSFWCAELGVYTAVNRLTDNLLGCTVLAVAELGFCRAERFRCCPLGLNRAGTPPLRRENRRGDPSTRQLVRGTRDARRAARRQADPWRHGRDGRDELRPHPAA